MSKATPRRRANRPVQTDAFPPAGGRTVRTTLSLPQSLATDLRRLSGRMGVSQSSFVSELLSEPIKAMAAIIDALPEQGATATDVKRARGRSLRFIENAVSQAQSLVEEVRDVRPRRRS